MIQVAVLDKRNKMKTLKQFLLEGVSKRSALSIFKKKTNLNISYEDMFKETLKEVFPHVHITSDEENENLLHHLVNASKNVKLIRPIASKNFITKNEIVRSTKPTIAIKVEVEENKCIVKHQFSIPEGRDFRDNEMTTLIDDINHVIKECLSFLTDTDLNTLTDDQSGNDLLYTITADFVFTIDIEEKYYLLFYIPKSIKEINGDLDLDSMKLTHFPKYLPNVRGTFDCNNNLLSSLKGCPKEVGGDFYCSVNLLTSLKYAPDKIGEKFNCSENNLTSLEGAPKFIGSDFYASSNKNLVSLKGIPKEVSGDFFLRNVGKQFTQDEIRAVCNVRGKVQVYR